MHGDRPTSGKVRAVRGFVNTLPMGERLGFVGPLADMRFDMIGRNSRGGPVYFDNIAHDGLRDDRYHAVVQDGAFVSIEWEGDLPTFRVEWLPKVTECAGSGAIAGAGFMIDPLTGAIVPVTPPPGGTAPPPGNFPAPPAEP